MIKLNTPYHVAEENVTVTFTEVKNGGITGTYPNATLTGTLEGNVLSATFHNTAVNAVGLIELTFNDNGFEGKWKNGLEPGPMRGKWSGECLSDSAKDSSGPATLKSEKKYEMKDFTENGLSSFIKKLNENLAEASQMELDLQEPFLDNLYRQLNEFISAKPEFVYLGKIAEQISQDYVNVWSSFFLEEEEEMMNKFALSIEALRSSGLIENVVKAEQLEITKVNEDFDEFTRFSNLLLSYFVYALDTVVEQNDAEELAEFIFSISASSHSELSDDDNAIPDQILDVLKALGYDVHEFEGSSEIFANYYLKSSVSSGKDYIAFSESIISDLYCP